MRENARDIALRIRGLRDDLGVSVEEMAETVGVSPRRYAAYETAAEDVPASVLSEIAARLKVDLGLLLTGETPRMTLFSVTRSGRGVGVDRREGYKYESLSAAFKDARIEPFIVTLPEGPADQPIPQNAHPGQEFNYMLAGRMLVKVQDCEVVLDVGDSVIFDAAKPHGMKALDGPAKFLAIIDA